MQSFGIFTSYENKWCYLPSGNKIKDALLIAGRDLTMPNTYCCFPYSLFSSSILIRSTTTYICVSVCTTTVLLRNKENLYPFDRKECKRYLIHTIRLFVYICLDIMKQNKSLYVYRILKCKLGTKCFKNIRLELANWK